VRDLLAERDYRRLLGAQFLGQGADGVAQAVLATVLVLDPLQESTPEKILGLFALTLLPYSLFSPFLGVFVDRWDRQKLLVWTNLLRCLLMVSLPLWSRTLPGDSALLAGVLGLLGLGRLFSTTKGATIPVVLHEHHLLRGNNLSSVGGTLSALAGGGLGLWLGSWLDADVALMGVSLVYLGAALTARRIKTNLAHAPVRVEGLGEALARVARELLDGLVEVGRRPAASIPLGAIFLLRMFALVVVVGSLLMVKARFDGESATSAQALGAFGVGAFVASLSAPALGRRWSKPVLILIGFAISATGITLLGGIARLPAVLALMCAGGFGGFITKVAVDAQVQEALPDIYRGRAFALYDILYNVASVVAALVVVVFEFASVRGLLIGAGIANFGFTILLGVAMRSTGIAATVPAND
jgi:MFS family permease